MPAITRGEAMTSIIGWGLYFAFVAAALATGWHDRLLELSTGKAVLLAVWLAFLGYSIRCGLKENIFKGLGTIFRFHWGRQVGLDLYIGASFMLAFIALSDGPMTALLWAVPILLFVNLASLVYILIHFEQIVARFM